MARRLTSYALSIALTLAAGGAAHADRVDDTVRTLDKDPSWTVRLQAVSVLGRLKDARAVPAVMRALKDSNDTVRGVAAQALADLGATDALPALRDAANDPSPFVRGKVAAAMSRLATPALASAPASPALKGRMHVEVGGVAAKARNTPPELTSKLRELIQRELSRTPGLTLEGRPIDGFSVDGSITTISRKTTDKFVEISCEVSYVVGRLPSKSIVMMTSGGATVQTPKTAFKREFERNLQTDALEGAVRGAHENLVAFIRTQKQSAQR